MVEINPGNSVREFHSTLTKSLFGGQVLLSLAGFAFSLVKGNPVVIAVSLVAFAISAGGFWAVRRLSLVHSAKVARYRGRIALGVFVGAYTVGTALVVWLDPVDLSPIIWGGIGLFGIFAVLELAILLHTSTLPDSQWATGAELAVVTFHYLLGAAVLGVAGGIVGLGSVYFRQNYPFVGATLLVEAGWIAALGLTILLARPAVIALASSSAAAVMAGFGAASIAGGDVLFGSAVVGLAVAALFLGITTYLGKLMTWGYFAGFVASAFQAYASVVQHEIGLAIAIGFVAISLALLTVTTFTAPEVGGLSRFANQTRTWTSRRYFLTSLPFFALLAAGIIWERQLVVAGTHAGLFAVAGLALACLYCIVILLISAIRRRK